MSTPNTTDSSLPPPGTTMSLRQALELAVSHHQAERYRNAEIIYRQILSQHPNNADALHLLGLIAHTHNRNDMALDLVGRATQIAPTMGTFWNTLGEVNRVLGRLDTAFHCYQKALKNTPDMPEALNNLGIVHAFRNEIAESVASFEKAIKLRPDYAEAHDGLGLTLLLDGKLRRGWQEQEWRWKKNILAHLRRTFSHPLWDGSSLQGKRILLHAEQGFGDVIQFCRYLPMVKALGAHVIFETPADVHRLMMNAKGWDDLVIRSGPGDSHLPPFDVHCPLMSLPLVMGTDTDTIPAEVPYLTADAELREKWRGKLEALGPGKKVGIAWAGRPSHPRDAGRTMPLANFLPLSKIPGVQLISLQKGDAALEQIKTMPPEMLALNAGPELVDFADTAALVDQLDFVLAVDTAVVHLAGALAKPFAVLLPFSPDWRWQLKRTDSPWYPTGTLLRQEIDTDWSVPLEAARKLLTELASK